MSKNFVSYSDIETIIEKIKLELDKKAVVVAITQEDYDALSEEEKNNGTIYFIIDYNEISGGGIATKLVIKGYYNSEDGKFYNEPSFSTETAISANYLYIDLAENIIYIYDSTTEEFSALGGGQGDGITKISMNGEELTVTDGEVDLGTVLTEHQDISGKQDKSTAVKYNGSSAVGSATKGVYVDASGNATAMTYELNKSVPADAKFTDTTYSKATTSDDGLMSKEDKAKLDGLSDVASSGSYNDLEDQPTIPTVNNGTLTIQKNGTNVQTFTANQSENTTANITVPTKVSELTNDSGFTSNTGTVTSVKVGTTSYDPSNGVVSLPAYPVNTNTTYTITQDTTDGHKFTFAGSDGTSKTITIPDNNTIYSLSSLGIENVKNYDQSKAIKSITRNGTTFTYTCLDGTTGTFTQQDDNTWTAMIGATASADGSAGYVPAPPSDGYNTKFLRADGSWSVPPDNNTWMANSKTSDGYVTAPGYFNNSYKIWGTDNKGNPNWYTLQDIINYDTPKRLSGTAVTSGERASIVLMPDDASDYEYWHKYVLFMLTISFDQFSTNIILGREKTSKTYPTSQIPEVALGHIGSIQYYFPAILADNNFCWGEITTLSSTREQRTDGSEGSALLIFINFYTRYNGGTPTLRSEETLSATLQPIL